MRGWISNGRVSIDWCDLWFERPTRLSPVFVCPERKDFVWGLKVHVGWKAGGLEAGWGSMRLRGYFAGGEGVSGSRAEQRGGHLEGALRLPAVLGTEPDERNTSRQHPASHKSNRQHALFGRRKEAPRSDPGPTNKLHGRTAQSSQELVTLPANPQNRQTLHSSHPADIDSICACLLHGLLRKNLLERMRIVFEQLPQPVLGPQLLARRRWQLSTRQPLVQELPLCSSRRGWAAGPP